MDQSYCLTDPAVDLAALQSLWDDRPRKIALFASLQQPAGIAIQEGFFSAYYESLQISGDVPTVSTYDTSSVVNLEAVYQQAVESGADLIIGPLTKSLVNQLAEKEDLPVPTLALNYADSVEESPESVSVRTGTRGEIYQILNLAWARNYRRAALITPEAADYDRLRSTFAANWQDPGREDCFARHVWRDQ